MGVHCNLFIVDDCKLLRVLYCQEVVQFSSFLGVVYERYLVEHRKPGSCNYREDSLTITVVAGSCV